VGASDYMAEPISIPAVLETIDYWLVRQLVLG
jgi:hypothetical protein